MFRPTTLSQVDGNLAVLPVRLATRGVAGSLIIMDMVV